MKSLTDFLNESIVVEALKKKEVAKYISELLKPFYEEYYEKYYAKSDLKDENLSKDDVMDYCYSIASYMAGPFYSQAAAIAQKIQKGKIKVSNIKDLLDISLFSDFASGIWPRGINHALLYCRLFRDVMNTLK